MMTEQEIKLNSKEKEVDIPNYGKVILKKWGWGDKCKVKGKVLNINIDNAGREKKEIDVDALLFWTLVYSIKSLPNYPEFSSYNDEDKKAQIVNDLGLGEDEPDDLGELIFAEVQGFNSIGDLEVKKK